MEVGYGMPGLKSHPLRHMKTFDDAFDVQRILVIAKEFLTNHSSCLLESEYSDFIRGELEGAMEANGDFLSSLIFCRALETSSCLTGSWWKAWCQCLRRRFHRSATRIGLKIVNESLHEDKDEPNCPQKLGPVWPRFLSVSGNYESTVVRPGSAGLIGHDRSGGLSSDVEPVDTGLGFVNTRENKEVQKHSQVMWKPTHEHVAQELITVCSVTSPHFLVYV